MYLTPTTNFARDERKRRSTPASCDTLESQIQAPRYARPRDHWRKAQNFAQGDDRDLPNAAKEAISAVEGLARVVMNAPTATLGELIKRLKREKKVDPAMAKSLEGLWAFTSNSPGVRHGSGQPPTIDEAQVAFVVEQCGAALLPASARPLGKAATFPLEGHADSDNPVR